MPDSSLRCYQYVQAHKLRYIRVARILAGSVMALTLLFMLDTLVDWQQRLNWPILWNTPVPTQVCLFMLAAALMLILSEQNGDGGKPEEERLKSVAIGIGILIPALFGLLVMYYSLLRFGFTLHRALMEPGNQQFTSFFGADSILMCALNLFIYWRYRHIEFVVFFGVGFLSLLVINYSLFILQGHYEQVPVLYNFTMSIPTAVCLFLLSSAVIVASIPQKGLLLPLFSDSLRSRLMAWLGVTGGILVMLNGFYNIHKLNSFAAIRYTGQLQVDFLLSGLITILLSPAIILIALRAVHYYNQSSLLAAEQQAMRHALECQTELLVMITDNVSTGLVLVDHQNQCKYMNPAAEKMFGIDCRTIQTSGKTMHEISHYIRPDGTPYPESECPLSNAMRKGELLQNFEDFLVRSDGKFFNISFSCRPVVVGGVVVAQVVEVQDITRQKEDEERLRQYMERLEESNENLEHFAYVASHDLQTPLRKISSLCDILSKDLFPTLDTEHRDYLDRIRKSSLRMQGLVSDLLLLARIGTVRNPMQMVDMGKVLKDVLHDLDVTIKAEQAEVHVGRMMSLEAIPVQMYQLLKNLVENSLKYHREGVPPVIHVSMHPAPVNACQLVVEDNGLGFEQEKTDKIFGLFVRLHGKEKYEGTGIGLTICKMVADRHGGSIRVRSVPGQGTTVFVTLPLHHEYQPEYEPPGGQRLLRYIPGQ